MSCLTGPIIFQKSLIADNNLSGLFDDAKYQQSKRTWTFSCTVTEDNLLRLFLMRVLIVNELGYVLARTNEMIIIATSALSRCDRNIMTAFEGWHIETSAIALSQYDGESNSQGLSRWWISGSAIPETIVKGIRLG